MTFSSPNCCCSVRQLCLTPCNPMVCSTLGFPVHHQLLELAQTLVRWVSAVIQPSHPLSLPSPAFCLSQPRGLFQWVGSWHQVNRVLELQLHQSFQWIFRVNFLSDWLFFTQPYFLMFTEFSPCRSLFFNLSSMCHPPSLPLFKENQRLTVIKTVKIVFTGLLQ